VVEGEWGRFFVRRKLKGWKLIDLLLTLDPWNGDPLVSSIRTDRQGVMVVVVRDAVWGSGSLVCLWLVGGLMVLGVQRYGV
jgi:hypothetical protein